MKRALDLFCGAGGATRGLQMAGYHVTGVDIAPQPNYCGDKFIQADAMAVPLKGYDFIWASPPCQHYSMYSRNLGTSDRFPDLVAPVRRRLEGCGTPWVIENVPGSPLKASLMLCGTMFALPLLRHRYFETSFPVPLLMPSCNHTGAEIPVYGNGTPQWHRERFGRNVRVDEQRAAMEIDWMPRKSLSQAIPPAYSHFIASALERS